MKAKYLLVAMAVVMGIWGGAVAENTEEVSGEYKGCFEHQPDDRVVADLPLKISNNKAASTVDNCIAECLDHYYRYAGILNGQFCLCGSMYGSQGAGDCSQNCYGNSSQLCGGLQAVSVYATGHLVPGPPEKLTVNQTSETRIGLHWNPPNATNGNLTFYLITANVSETYSQIPQSPRSWTYPASVFKAGLLSLSPATRYNITLTAVNQFGTGHSTYDLVWTQIKEPMQPETPMVVKKVKGTITVRLKPVSDDFGPITTYRVAVSSDKNIILSNNYLKSWDDTRIDGLPWPPYVAGELDPKVVTNETEFVVGDGKRYGTDKNYYNAPLPSGGEFYVSLGAVSSFHGVTKASYSSFVHSHNGVILLDVPFDEESDSDDLTTFLKVAILLCGLLLVAALCLYVFLQKKYGGNRYRRRDQQELNIRGAVTEVENSAFVYDEYLPEEEDKKVDYYDMLHQRIWNIPRNFLDIQTEVISQGSFGPILRGSVQRKGQVTPVAVYAIQDGELASDDKRQMLESLDVLVRGGDHRNTISLTGTCESQDTLYIVLEHHPATLKDVLLQSRCLQHGQSARSRICSLSEASLFDFMIGVAQGMCFLASKKIVHKHLSCSNILMVDGVIPKITGFGIAQFNRRRERPDYTRWLAHEVFSRKIQVTKSDVWSFGVTLWEICALGGTPYAEVPNGQVAGAVMRGLRLPQLSYVGDALYQLMLQCWQIDLDERPPFSDIVDQLESLHAAEELNLDINQTTTRNSFQYAAFNEELEYY